MKPLLEIEKSWGDSCKPYWRQLKKLGLEDSARYVCIKNLSHFYESYISRKERRFKKIKSKLKEKYSPPKFNKKRDNFQKRITQLKTKSNRLNVALRRIEYDAQKGPQVPFYDRVLTALSTLGLKQCADYIEFSSRQKELKQKNNLDHTDRINLKIANARLKGLEKKMKKEPESPECRFTKKIEKSKKYFDEISHDFNSNDLFLFLEPLEAFIQKEFLEKSAEEFPFQDEEKINYYLILSKNLYQNAISHLPEEPYKYPYAGGIEYLCQSLMNMGLNGLSDYISLSDGIGELKQKRLTAKRHVTEFRAEDAINIVEFEEMIKVLEKSVPTGPVRRK